MSREIAVIGAPDFTTGFRLAGVRRFENVREPEKEAQLEETLESIMADDDIGIIVMHDDDIQYLSQSTRHAVEESIEPTVVTIGSGSAGGAGIRNQIKRAIGIDLMAEED